LLYSLSPNVEADASGYNIESDPKSPEGIAEANVAALTSNPALSCSVSHRDQTAIDAIAPEAHEGRQPTVTTTLSNEEALSLVRGTFDAVYAARTLEALNEIVSKNDRLLKNAMSETRYPKLKFSLAREELADLRTKGILDAENRLNFDGYKPSAIEKLLYSVLWKNGDIGKERHIVRGVTSSDSQGAGEDGLVFYYFGRHLRDKSNPIVDQHVIRAFRLHELSQGSSREDLTTVRKNAKVEEETIRRYISWLKSLNSDLTVHPGYQFHVDKVLFALGKAVKITKGNENNEGQ
jgi:hypothetical protein